MSKTRKILFTITLALIWVFAYTVNVNAFEFTFDNLFTKIAAGEAILDSGDTFIFNEDELISENGSVTITRGTISIYLATEGDNKELIFSLNGDAVINEGKEVNMSITGIPDSSGITTISFIVNESSTLTINGTLIVPTTRGATLTNNGTVNISEGGTLEIRQSATYTGSGTINVSGTLVDFGKKDESKLNGANVVLDKTGTIISRNELTITNSNEEAYTLEKESLSEYTSSVTENAKMTANEENSVYQYTLKEIVVEEPVESESTDEGEEPTIPEEPVVVEPTEEEVVDETVVEEVSENPTTGDEIAVFAVIFGIAVVGLVSTLIIRKRIK